ncbi:outer membrane protein [Pseudoxanthomonas sp. GM95]|uniref:MipA/OmpV family protein n=1 Tax=Pseudoxanthomonas sp. GM95 TaxID=1881043 RepID=UPI0008B738A4|nr:MipA/OmpV family protein [Pseudoxanthomonas sp. GM95]SEL08270.1 outer membrane protein [Pseudoxanthomonas sp. GM95]
MNTSQRLIFSALVLACAPAFAQQGDDSAPAPATEASNARGWSFGLGALVTDSPYAGEDHRTLPFPLISYGGERFYVRGLSGGYHLLNSRAFTLDAELSVRTDGIDADDFGRAELARNGIDKSQLSDRDRGIDAGLAAQWRGPAGILRVGAKTDVSNASEGYELSADYGFPIRVGTGVITPRIGVARYSDDLANYYYGISDEEVARGVTAYSPGAVTFARASVDFAYALGNGWGVVSRLSYSQLPDELQDSPLVEPDTDGVTSLMIGLTRHF